MPSLLAEIFAQELRRQLPDQNKRQPILDWARATLPDHAEKPFNDMHRWLAGELERATDQRGQKINLLAPRGNAKSTIGTLFYPLREICERREAYIWILSDTKGQAETHLENIRYELEHNTRLHHRYGADQLRRAGSWTVNCIQLANGVTVEAYGTGQRLRGRRRGSQRPTLIVCDDLQNDSHSVSRLNRLNSRSWFFGTLMKAGRPQTNIVNVGTALHREAIAMELDTTPGWRSQIFAAIRDWPTRMELWNEWEKLYTDISDNNAEAKAKNYYLQHKSHMHEGARVLWPEEESLYHLMTMRAQDGHTAFEREKQNSPIDPERCEFPEIYFDQHIWYEGPPPKGLRVLTLDPAAGSTTAASGGKSRIGDYSSWCLLTVTPDGMCYVNAWMVRQPLPEVVQLGHELARQFQPDAVGVEVNTFQQLIQPEWDRQTGKTQAPIAGIHNSVNKLIRIRRLGPYLSQRRLRFSSESPGAREIVNQLQDFPIGNYDDGPDSLEMAVRLAQELLGAQPDSKLKLKLDS